MADNEVYDDLNAEDLEGEAGGAEDMDAAAEQELEAMKARLADMEKEAAKLKEMQDKAQKEAGMAPSGSSAADAAAKEEADGRSVYVGNVDYSCTPEELQMHFQSCGTVNRVTILTDKMGNPKGFAYIEFLEADAVTNACLLNESELRNRAIKVLPKRTNVPGMKAGGRGGRGGRGRGGRGGAGFYGGYPGMMPMMPPPFMFGYGYPPYGGGGGRGRGRGRGGYQPY